MIWVLVVVLMGLNGPFRYTERFMSYKECAIAQRHWRNTPDVWVGNCRKIKGDKDGYRINTKRI